METTTPATYHSYPQYEDATRGAQEAIDAVFAATAKQTSAYKGLDVDSATGNLGASFTWHDGAQYRVQLTRTGVLDRLFRLQYTGRMIDDGGVMVEDVVWRTVREFSKDRAGKVLARSLPGLPASNAWETAAVK
jgi:hypothetical protein